MRLRLIATLCLLAACQLTLPGTGRDAPPPNPITGGAIAVTALDAPAAATPLTATPAPKPVAEAATLGSAPAKPAAPLPTLAAPAAPKPGLTEPAATKPAPAEPATPAEAAPPPPPKSPGQIACVKVKGAWVRAGKSGTMTCVRTLRDSGKQCSRESDCEGQCLARSRTCAPVSPMFGCNEVLQDNGQRVTLCID